MEPDSHFDFSIIVATDKKGGIAKTVPPSFQSDIPWKIKEDLCFYKSVTTYNPHCQPNVIIMGRKTFESMPSIAFADRINIVLSTTIEKNIIGTDIRWAKSWDNVFDILRSVRITYPKSKFFIIGGRELIVHALQNFGISAIYWTYINHDYECDIVIPIQTDSIMENSRQYSYVALDHNINKNVSVVVKVQNVLSDDIQFVNNSVDQSYLSILQKLQHVKMRQTRNDPTYALFGERMVFDVSDTVPLLSTKKVNVEAVMEELLFFIRGDTDTRKLEAVGVNIWKENTSKQFMEKIGLKNIPIKFMGPMYGYQWRHFNAPYNPNNDANIGGIDQLADVIHLLKTDPYSRRIMMTTYNPSQAREGVLYPCHGIITQFFIEDNGSLSCQTYQRSADFCVGVPFNMASYGILIHIIAHIVDRKPGRLIMIFGDTHMYSKHDSLANVQLSRETMMYPECKFRISAECPKNIDSVKREHLIVENYKSHPYIPYQFIA